MKNSSIGSSLFERADRNSAIVQFLTAGPLDCLCSAATVQQTSLAASVQPAGSHVVEGSWGCMCVCGVQSSTAEAPAAADLSHWRVVKRSADEERVIVLTVASERGETGTPVSTLVSGSSSSSSRRRWERERVMEGRRGESGWLGVETSAGLLRCDE